MKWYFVHDDLNYFSFVLVPTLVKEMLEKYVQDNVLLRY